MITEVVFLLIVGAYLLGSIPTAVWIGKIFYGIDVRDHGSGNAGATNTFRTLGKKAGIPVLIIDVLKGFAAVKLSLLSPFTLNLDFFVGMKLALGFAALLGHVFPVFASFRGGKGIATLLGVIIATHPLAALCLLGVFLFFFSITHYVSLSSIAAAFSFPFIMLLVFQTQIPSLIFFSFMIAFIVLLTHQKNIERLLRKKESKMYLFKRKK